MPDRKSLRPRRLRVRSNLIRTSSMAIILVACMLLVLHTPANAEAVDKQAGAITIKAHAETSPDHYDMMPPCSSWTSVPKKGACRGLGRSTGPEKITGDFRGQSKYVYGFFILDSGRSYGSGVDYFTGTISGCGSGSVVYEAPFSSDGRGSIHGRWQMIEGSGSGGLTGVRGSGTFYQTTRPDGSTSGEYSGTVSCSK